MIVALTGAKMYYIKTMLKYNFGYSLKDFTVFNDSHSIVSHLVHPIASSGRNVNTDNLFMSIPLAQDHLHSYRLTVVGTFNKKIKGIPAFMHSRIFALKDNMTLSSY